MTVSPAFGSAPDVATVKAAAKGRWTEILTRAGIPAERLDGKGHPCPVCGEGDDRFSAFPDVDERGAVHCRVCGTKCGDGLATLQWLLACLFPEALAFAAECLGFGEPCGIPPRAVLPAEAAATNSKQAPSGKKPKRIFGTPGDAEAAILRTNRGWRSGGSWDYLDAGGSHVFTIARFDLPELDENGKPKKEFRPIVACEGGFTIGGMSPAGRPLFDLPGVLKSRIVFVCEGEKACTALQRLGLVATTSPFGAQSPEKADWSALAGKFVILLPDNDEAGETYLERVARLLAELEDPPTVRALRLPGLPEAGDAHDWLEDLDAKEPDNLKKELLRMADEAERYEAPTTARTNEGDAAGTRAQTFPAPLGEAAKIGVVGEFLETVMPETEADEAAVLTQLLVACGNVVGRSYYFRIGGVRHYSNLFAAIVGATSRSRKGTSWGYVGEVMALADGDWSRRCVASGLTSGEGVIFAVRDPTFRTAPIYEGTGRDRRKVGEELQVDDEGVLDKRLLTLESEFGRVLQAMNRDSNTLSAVLRQSWDGDSVLRIMTKNSPYRATDAHVSVAGHITDEELRDLLSNVDCRNGLANRFLWLKVDRSKELPFGGDLPPERLEGIGARLGERLTRLEGFSREIHFAPSVRDAWVAAYSRLSRPRRGILDAILARAEPIVRRVAMIYAILDGKYAIEAHHLDAALEVWRFAEDSASIIFGDAAGDPKRDRLLEAIRQEPGLAKSNLYKACGNNLTRADLDRHLAHLEGAKLIRRESIRGEGNKPAERFFPVAKA